MPARDPTRDLAHAYLARHDALAPLAARASGLLQVRRAFRDVLPANIADAVEVANLRGGALVVQTGSAASAAKLRQLTPRLIAQLSEKGVQVSAIRVVIQGQESGLVLRRIAPE